MKYLLLTLCFLFSSLVIANEETNQKWTNAYKKGSESLKETISVYKLFIRKKNKSSTFKEWLHTEYKSHQIYKKCKNQNDLEFSKCLSIEVHTDKNKNTDFAKRTIKLSRQLYYHREAKDILDSCFKQTGSEGMPITCIKEASLTKNCPECTIYLAKKVFILYRCGQHIKPKDITACEEKYATVNEDELKKLEIANKHNVSKAKVKLGVSQLPYNGLNVPLYGGMGYGGLGRFGIGMHCTDPNSEGKIICNGVTYRPDTSTYGDRRRIIKRLEENSKNNTEITKHNEPNFGEK